MEYGELICTKSTVKQIGDSYITEREWEWEGPPVARVDRHALRRSVNIPADNIRVGGRLMVGQYAARVIGDNLGIVILAREDGYPWLYAIRYRLAIWAEDITARVVLTLAVWGLAQWPRGGEIPSWWHVKAFWRKKWREKHGPNQ